MATTVTIDSGLLRKALEVSGGSSQHAVVIRALQEFIARRQQKRLKELFGQLDWDAGYDCKAERSRT